MYGVYYLLGGLMIGSIFIKLAFGGAVLSLISYYLSFQYKEFKYIKFARTSYHISVFGIMIASAVLMYLILTHQFQYTYVWSYSSVELPTGLLAASFWAGQEGSFLLWALFASLIGVFLLQYSSNKGYESQLMFVYTMILTALLLMLIVKDPFKLVWQSFPGQVDPGFQPANGRGLNPLLQNYWMVIHPPILFIGFAAMGATYAFAVAALLKKDYTHWVKPATPWFAFGALALGTGIMLGGYWAYETLGWGGYWAWDPVENSSLVPWLVGLAALHTMLAQRRSGAFVRTNLTLGILTFVLVLYSTFLTRSGVLGATSVHSFVEPGWIAYILLLSFIIYFAGFGFGLLFSRMREMPHVPIQYKYISREFALFLGSASLVFVALFTIVGTSSPIITNLVKGQVSAVDISFYEKTTTPFGIAIVLLAGLGQVLWWKQSNIKALLRSMLLAIVIASIGTGIMMTLGISSIQMILLTWGAWFVLVINLQIAIRVGRGNPRYIGGAIAHIGIGLLFLGFITTAKYDKQQTIQLVQGQPVQALGYTLTYNGYTPAGHERWAFNVTAERNGRTMHLAPVMYQSDFNNSLIRNPDIVNRLTFDFYLAPLGLDTKEVEGSVGSLHNLKRGEQKEIDGYSVTFTGFDFDTDAHMGMMTGTDEMRIGVVLNIGKDGKTERVVPEVVNRNSEMDFRSALTSDNKIRFNVISIRPDQANPENSSVQIEAVSGGATLTTGGPTNTQDVLIVEASIKPFINLIWLGTLIGMAGLVITIIRRSREARPKEQDSWS
jgi:cytochrome c-type biogenesis protein CcmF